jgi:hypothetical protein
MTDTVQCVTRSLDGYGVKKHLAKIPVENSAFPLTILIIDIPGIALVRAQFGAAEYACSVLD